MPKSKLRCTAPAMLFALLAVSPLQAQTLIEAVEQTLKTNPEVLAAYSGQFASEAVVVQALSGYYPKLDLEMAAGRETSTNASTAPDDERLSRRESTLALSQMLFDGYATKSQVEQAQSSAESSTYAAALVEEGVGLRTVQAYLNVLRQEALLLAANRYLDAHERTHQQIVARVGGGVSGQVDMDQAQSRLAMAKIDKLEAERKLRDAQFGFKRLVGDTPQDLSLPGDICCDFLPKTLKQAIETAWDKHPGVKARVAEYEANLAQIQGAKAAYAPQVTADLGAGRDRDLDGVSGRNDEEYAMLRLQQNLLKGGADAARVKEYGQRSLAAEQQAVDALRQVEENTRVAWNRLESVQDRLVDLESHAKSSAATRDAYLKQFSLGLHTLLDLLDVEAEVFAAQQEHINGQYDERVARYTLLAEMGVLIETLGLGPKRTTE